MADDKTKVAANQAEADKAQAQKAGSVEGAQSVAEAVKRVADAAVAAVHKSSVSSVASDFTVTGSGGGRFTIDGKGFSTGGTVTVGGKPVKTVGWGSTRIEGEFPEGVQPGQIVVVHVDAETTQTGQVPR